MEKYSSHPFIYFSHYELMSGGTPTLFELGALEGYDSNCRLAGLQARIRIRNAWLDRSVGLLCKGYDS